MYRNKLRLHTPTVVVLARQGLVVVATDHLPMTTITVVVLRVAIAHVVITTVVVRLLAVTITTLEEELGTILLPLVACEALHQKSTLHLVVLTATILTGRPHQDVMPRNPTLMEDTIVHRGLALLHGVMVVTMSALPVIGRWSFSSLSILPRRLLHPLDMTLLISSDVRLRSLVCLHEINHKVMSEGHGCLKAQDYCFR